MKIVFKTNSDFLQQHFHNVKQVLLGVLVDRKDATSDFYKPQFGVEQQPVFEFKVIEEEQKIEDQAAIQNVFKSSIVKSILNYGLGGLMLLASVLLIVFYGPSVYYTVFPEKVVEQQTELAALAANLDREQKEAEQQEFMDAVDENPQQQEKQPERYLPEQNLSLPTGDWLIIPVIGVNTQLQPTPTAEEALDTGVWWVPDFGLPGSLNQPMIVAGHRYGWKWWWRDDYWKYHSFYKLPELQVGDRVEVISDQRKFVYEIYAQEEGEEITDYQADLILYTCKYLSSPVRFFRYGKLLME